MSLTLVENLKEQEICIQLADDIVGQKRDARLAREKKISTAGKFQTDIWLNLEVPVYYDNYSITLYCLDDCGNEAIMNE